jgi:MFS family permease
MHSNHRSYLYLPQQLKKFKEGIYPLYIAHMIRGFVSSLIGFFIPIYFLKIGFSLPEILWFFAVNYYFATLFSILAGAIGNKVGLKHTMMISLPLYLIYLLGIMFLEKNISIISFYGLAIFGAFISTLYWIPLYSLFARFSSNGKKSATQVSTLLSLRSIASIIAPLLGGFISIYFGFEALFFLAVIILIIPIVVLLHSRDIHPHINFSLKDLIQFFRKHTRLFIMIMLDSFGTFSEEILWPLFVFLILQDSMSVGIVGSLIGVGTISFTLIIGKIVAKHNYLLIIKISAFMLATSWAIKTFISGKITIYALSLLAAMFAIMFSVPLADHTYKTAKKDKNLDEFIVFKQILTYLSRLLAVLLTILLVSKLNISFLLTSISYLIISIF